MPLLLSPHSIHLELIRMYSIKILFCFCSIVYSKSSFSCMNVVFGPYCSKVYLFLHQIFTILLQVFGIWQSKSSLCPFWLLFAFNFHIKFTIRLSSSVIRRKIFGGTLIGLALMLLSNWGELSYLQYWPPVHKHGLSIDLGLY